MHGIVFIGKPFLSSDNVQLMGFQYGEVEDISCYKYKQPHRATPSKFPLFYQGKAPFAQG